MVVRYEFEELGQYFSGTAPEDMGGDVVLLGGGRVDDDDGGVVLVCYFGQ